MTPEDVRKIWPTQMALARALGVTQSSVSEWFAEGGPGIPVLRQMQIQRLTRGRLKADLPDYLR